MDLNSEWFDDMHSESEVTHIPCPSRFATVRMDPVAMVQDLGLPESSPYVARARAMSTKKYLVYLDLPAGTAYTDSKHSQTTPFIVLLVGTAPCPDDRERVMTSDMVVPIFPNTAHPRGRRAVRPTRPFPSARAYLWTASEMWVRVRFMPEGTYDNEDAFRLDEAESEALEHVLQEDDARYAELREEMKEKPEHRSPHGEEPVSEDAASEETITKALMNAGLGNPHPSSIPRLPEGIDHASDEGHEDFEAVADILQALGWYEDPKEKYMPIVEASLDIEDDVRNERFASPEEFWKEMAEIRVIIDEALQSRSTAGSRFATRPSQ